VVLPVLRQNLPPCRPPRCCRSQPRQLPRSRQEAGSVELIIADRVARVALTGASTAGAFVAMLRVTVGLPDAWRQGKIGGLPRSLTVGRETRTLCAGTGGLYYWSDSGVLAADRRTERGTSGPDPSGAEEHRAEPGSLGQKSTDMTIRRAY
jgi:hypothetical protein